MFCLCSQNFPLVLTFATLLYLKNKQINKYNWDFNLTPLVWHQNVVELDISLFTTSHTLMTSILIFLLEHTVCASYLSAWLHRHTHSHKDCFSLPWWQRHVCHRSLTYISAFTYAPSLALFVSRSISFCLLLVDHLPLKPRIYKKWKKLKSWLSHVTVRFQKNSFI